MNLPSSPALVEEYSAATSSDGEQCVLSSTTPTPAAYYWPDKTTEHSRLSRFGMTSEPLTAIPGEELLTWFRAASRARTSAQLVRVPAWTESEADCGWKCIASFAKYDPRTSTWKTRQCSLLADSDEYSETWPNWGSMQNGECSEVAQLGWTVKGSASGLLPAPQASDGPKWYTVSKESASKRPKAGRQMMMIHVVGLTAYEHLSKWWANPQFYEAAMGWPIKWTDLKPLETGRFREWQQQHGGF